MKSMKFKVFALSCLLACFTLVSCGEEPDQDLQGCDPAAYIPSVEPQGVTEIFVPMRDCVKLATDVHLPVGEPPFPCVLARIPYGKRSTTEELGIMSIAAELFTSYGFAVIVQDTRGCFQSQGIWHPFINEQNDGLDTVHWIEAQPWFDGNLGMFGGSYYGFTQYALAHQMPESLKTIVPMVALSSIYSTLYLNGVPRADITVGWSLSMVPGADDHSMEDAALSWPLMEGDDNTVGDIEYYNSWLENVFDDDFYEAYLPHDAIQRIEVPVMMISGWFDVFNRMQLADFEQLESRLDRGDARIIIGPWSHSMGLNGDHDLDFDDARMMPTFITQVVEWYDVHLRGAPAKTDRKPIQLYDPGKEQWFERDSLWPSVRQQKTMYLAGDQSAVNCGSEGGLTSTMPDSPTTITYTYDPLDPIRNVGGPLLSRPTGCKEQPPQCGRQDIVRFQSQPFTGDFTIDGDISLQLTVSSTALDTAFVARMSLVKPDGKAYFIRDGAMTLSHRHGNQLQASYQPGEQVDISIELPPLLWTVHAGESLRLEIMSSNFPRLAQHPNVDRDWFSQTDPPSAEQTLHLNTDQPSKLVVDIAP